MGTATDSTPEGSTKGTSMGDKQQIAALVGRALGKGLIWLVAWRLGNNAVENLGVTPDALFDACGVLILVGLNVYDSVKARNNGGITPPTTPAGG